MRVGFGSGLAIIAGLLAVPGSAAAQGSAQVTFTKDVAPILMAKCAECHRPGAMAPMSLVSYKDARPWARSLKTRVVSRDMPPFHIDRTVGIQQFKNDPSLTQAEIDTIVKWVDSGSPQGNPADMPPLRQFKDPNAWQIGEPDIVVKFPKFLVPAASPDLYGDLFADIPIDSDRYIKAIQTRSATAESHKVVHHALSYTVSPDAIEGDMSNEGGQFLVEYASGKNAEVYPDGSGVLLKAGDKARVSYHTHSYGEDTQMEIELGMVLYPKGYVPKKIRWSKQLAQPTTQLDIPPGQVARSDGYVFMHKPARIIAFQPHLHLLGTKQCLELIYPTEGATAKTEVVNCVNFNNSWHISYNYADEVQPIVPAGTVLHNIQWHDNTSANPRASDPRNWVGNGN
ncbi:MAG: hypothetical protein AB7N65_21780, partial [Vicinamibacterales bacterium]